MNKYLEGGALSEEEIKKGLRLRTLGHEITPMLCGSAFKNKGVQAMLDAVIGTAQPVDIPRSWARTIMESPRSVLRDDAAPSRRSRSRS